MRKTIKQKLIIFRGKKIIKVSKVTQTRKIPTNVPKKEGKNSIKATSQ